jgi:hypothetical protein
VTSTPAAKGAAAVAGKLAVPRLVTAGQAGSAAVQGVLVVAGR